MNEQNPWKTLSSKTVYQNPWIRVREDEVIRPDGKAGIYGVVETRIACGVVAMTESNEVYLVGQYRYTMDEYSWEIIEGGNEEGEPALEAAKRELQEEAGLIARNWEELGPEIHLSNCHSSEVARIFLARNLSDTASSPEGTEILKVKKLPFEKCLAMVEAGEIKDAVSIIALQRVATLLQD